MVYRHSVHLPFVDKLPNEEIQIVRRIHGSSSTAGTSEYLYTATRRLGCPDAWPDKTDGQPNKGSTIEWPSSSKGQTGSGNVAKYLRANAYSIGYLDSGHGHSEGFAEVELQNRAGTFLDSKTSNENGGIAEAAVEMLKLDPALVCFFGNFAGGWLVLDCVAA